MPPLNGRFALDDDDLENSRYQEADYVIARDCVYMALANSDAEEVKAMAFDLAKKNNLSYFDVSGSGDIPLFLFLLICLLFMDSWGILAGIPALIILVVFGAQSKKSVEHLAENVGTDYTD